MRFRILGPLQVWDGVAWSPVSAAQHRVLLAVFLTEPNRPITMDRLVDELWRERPPQQAAKTIQVYVGRLRRLLAGAPAEIVATRNSGYQLLVNDGDVDAELFERMIGSGREALAAGELEAGADQLRDALALWRGPAMSDVPESPTITAEAVRLEQVRLGAIEDRMAAELTLGHHTRIVDELGHLVEEHPLREQLHAHHILALYRCGRRAEALAAYRNARRVLIEELGLEPGPQLRGIEQAILTDDQAPAVEAVRLDEPADRLVPAQLPAEVGDFTGRALQLKHLDALLDRYGGPHPVLVISTVAGAAGVGKTALAVRWAHSVRDRFPDGQLYVNLRGYSSDKPLRPIDALAGFLRALGISPEQVPVEESEAASLYRSLLADKRMLVVLDNANHPNQVRPLLPASPHCAVVVTSRDRLAGLVARDGATCINLDVLTVEESRVLLTRLLGPERVEAEPDAAAELARRCGHLPLALRIAAANLNGHPQTTIAEYVSRLAGGDRLAVLEAQGDPESGIRAAFDYSYAALPADARRVFRLLGLVPGPDATDEAVGALTGYTPAQAGLVLEQIAAAHLIHEHSLRRYSLHDLLRLYAASCAAAEETELERVSALDRLLGFYLDSVDTAALLLYPQTVRLPMTNTGSGTAFDDNTHASAWMDVELPNLVAAITYAAQHGPQRFAWRLADALRGYLYLGENTVDWRVIAEAAHDAAAGSGDLSAQASAELSLAALCFVLNRFETAIEHSTRAHELARQAGWDVAESTALSYLGTAWWGIGDARQAADHYDLALAIDRRVGRAGGQAMNLGNLAPIHAALGQLELAANYRIEAIELSRQIGSVRLEGVNLAGLSEIYHAQGRFDDAVAAAKAALEIFQAAGQRHSEAYPLRVLACVHRDLGHFREATELADAALKLASDYQDTFREASARVTLGSIQLHTGRAHQAIDNYARALDLAQQVGDRYQEAEARIGLAVALHANGERDGGAEHARQALAIARENSYRLLESDALAVIGT